MIEMAANGSLFAELERIRELNDRIAAGEAPQGRTSPVRLHVIRPRRPIPLDPDYLLGRIDGETLVALGYHDAWRYLMAPPAGGVELSPEATRMDDGGPGVGFRVRLDGPATIAGVRGPRWRCASRSRSASSTASWRTPAAITQCSRASCDTPRSSPRRCCAAGRFASTATAPCTAARCTPAAARPSCVRRGGAGRTRRSRSRSCRPATHATTLVMTPTRRQVAAQVGSLHARNTGNLPEGARTVLRYARALLSR